MDVPIQHIIGTIALMGLVISIGLAYGIITDSMQTEIRKQQLQQVSENVALNLVEIINLAEFSNSLNGTMTRTLNLPIDLSGKTYIIEITNDTAGPNNCYVKAYLATTPYLNATSTLPLQSSQPQIALMTSDGTLTGNQIVRYSATIYGGGNDKVVWAWKGSGITWAGIGLLGG